MDTIANYTNSLYGCLLKNTTCVSISSAIIATLLFIYRRRKLSIKRKRSKYPSNVVILHQFFRGHNSPNTSPFCVKLETYLRINKIPFQSDFGLNWSSRGQIPWITYNNEDVADSEICLQYLNEQFKIDLNKHLNQKQLAIAHAFRVMLESDMFFLLSYEIWYADDHNVSLASSIPSVGFVIKKFVRMKFLARLRFSGMWPLSGQERLQRGKDILKSIDSLLAGQTFCLGEQICELDCIIFGFLNMVINVAEQSEYHNYCLDHLPNACKYFENMKTLYYPDWKELINK